LGKYTKSLKKCEIHDFLEKPCQVLFVTFLKFLLNSYKASKTEGESEDETDFFDELEGTEK